MTSGGLPGKGRDADGDEGTFMAQTCPGRRDHLGRGKPPPSKVLAMRHAGAVAFPKWETQEHRNVQEWGGKGEPATGGDGDKGKHGGTRECPVEGCPGRAGTRTAMRVHFWCRHVRDVVIILEEVNLPHPRCS